MKILYYIFFVAIYALLYMFIKNSIRQKNSKKTIFFITAAFIIAFIFDYFQSYYAL